MSMSWSYRSRLAASKNCQSLQSLKNLKLLHLTFVSDHKALTVLETDVTAPEIEVNLIFAAAGSVGHLDKGVEGPTPSPDVKRLVDVIPDNLSVVVDAGAQCSDNSASGLPRTSSIDKAVVEFFAIPDCTRQQFAFFKYHVGKLAMFAVEFLGCLHLGARLTPALFHAGDLPLYLRARCKYQR